MAAINAEAAAADREIEADHFGITLLVAEEGVPAHLAAQIRRQRPEVDPEDLVAVGWPHLHRLIDRYLAAGLSKFVVVPVGGGLSDGFLDRFGTELLPRQN